MKVLIVGATGAIGRRLVPRLLKRGHEVVGTCRSPEKIEQLLELGAEPVVLDALDALAVHEAVAYVQPEAIVHQATAHAGIRLDRDFDRAFALTNRLRTEGTDNLLIAARETGVTRFVAQSSAGMRTARDGRMVKNEGDSLDPDPPAKMRESQAAMCYLEQSVTDVGGIALRYGAFYGDANDAMVDPVRKRQFPIVGDGGGYSSWVHLEDAAAATVLALEHDGPAIYNVTDDEPAPAREWLPALAKALGARPPRRVPAWLARPFAGVVPIRLGTDARGASNAKAKRELGWTPLRYPSWRQGFAEVYAKPRRSTAAVPVRPRAHVTRTSR